MAPPGSRTADPRIGTLRSSPLSSTFATTAFPDHWSCYREKDLLFLRSFTRPSRHSRNRRRGTIAAKGTKDSAWVVRSYRIHHKKELFVTLLSHVRQGTEHANKAYQELSQVAQNQQVKGALQARAFVSQSVLEKLDQCFKLINEKPVKLSGRLTEVLVEDCRRELSDIESPAARRLFILAKAVHLNHLRIGEYIALTAAADMSGHYGVGVLLESCLADKLAFVERTRRLIRDYRR